MATFRRLRTSPTVTPYSYLLPRKVTRSPHYYLLATGGPLNLRHLVSQRCKIHLVLHLWQHSTSPSRLRQSTHLIGPYLPAAERSPIDLRLLSHYPGFGIPHHLTTCLSLRISPTGPSRSRCVSAHPTILHTQLHWTRRTVRRPIIHSQSTRVRPTRFSVFQHVP